MLIDNNATSNRLFYLIGFQRSGTTLLCHLIDKHPETVCAEEPEISKRLVYRQLDLLRDTDFDSIKKSLDFYQVPAEKYLEVVDSYLKNNMSEDAFIKTSYGLFNTKNALCIGAKEVVDLTAARYDYLNRLLHYHNNNIKIIFIERDIKGVVNSFIKLGFFPPNKKWITNFNMKRFAKKYINTLNQIDELLSKIDAHFLTYESFLKDPRMELRKLYTFLDVNNTEDILDMILNTPSKGIRINYNGVSKEAETGWQQNLSARQILWLDNLYNQRRQGRILEPN